CFDGPYAVVGDRFHDIDAAVRAGVPSIGCGYGCARPGELDQASVVVESPRQIPDAVKRLIG
ncbi:MAG: HAD hydrolase-like protein, partial [Eggerthellaceae bacterium]|nr:HAD hydrolase-like protein [Eggerthellaceae bacterium]